MPDREEYRLTARLLREGAEGLRKEAVAWQPDPFDAKPSASTTEAFDMLHSAVREIERTTEDLAAALRAAVNESVGEPLAIPEAVTRVVDRLREFYRIELRFRQITPPQLFAGCFDRMTGFGNYYSGRVLTLADELDRIANDPAMTGAVRHPFTLDRGPVMDQLCAELARVTDVIRDVGAFREELRREPPK
jgi:hypothetical protein